MEMKIRGKKCIYIDAYIDIHIDIDIYVYK